MKPSDTKNCKVVFVTGGASGTGYAICEVFAQKGWNIALTSRDLKKASKSAEKLKGQYSIIALPIELDLSRTYAIQEAFKKAFNLFGRLDSLVLCAADLGFAMDPFEITEQIWDSVINTNTRGMFFCSQQAALIMKKGKGGTIVAIGSNIFRRAVRNRCAYIASKGGVVALTRALALDFAAFNIRVNTVVAGSIHTERWDNYDEELIRKRRDRIPLGQEARPQDIALAAYFLAAGDSANITGVELVVDGGVDVQLFPGV